MINWKQLVELQKQYNIENNIQKSQIKELSEDDDDYDEEEDDYIDRIIKIFQKSLFSDKYQNFNIQAQLQGPIHTKKVQSLQIILNKRPDYDLYNAINLAMRVANFEIVETLIKYCYKQAETFVYEDQYTADIIKFYFRNRIRNSCYNNPIGMLNQIIKYINLDELSESDLEDQVEMNKYYTDFFDLNHEQFKNSEDFIFPDDLQVQKEKEQFSKYKKLLKQKYQTNRKQIYGE